jgi:hypothetical protein
MSCVLVCVIVLNKSTLCPSRLLMWCMHVCSHVCAYVHVCVLYAPSSEHCILQNTKFMYVCVYVYTMFVKYNAYIQNTMPATTNNTYPAPWLLTKKTRASCLSNTMFSFFLTFCFRASKTLCFSASKRFVPQQHYNSFTPGVAPAGTMGSRLFERWTGQGSMVENGSLDNTHSVHPS